MTNSDANRFWSYVDKSGAGGCWLWTGAKGKGYDTYGRFNVRGKVHKSTRLAYWLVIGPYDLTLELRHTCDVPACVNPSHLIPSTHAENMADMKAKGRGNGRLRGVTHCSKGHPFDGDNLIFNKAGSRMCKTCRKHIVAVHNALASERRRQNNKE